MHTTVTCPDYRISSSVEQADVEELCILYMSCDKFSDLWQPYFKLFRRFWPDCAYKIYLLSNHRQEEIENVTSLAVGDDISWSDNMIKALSRLNNKYVLLLLDDFLLIDRVKSAKIKKILQWIHSSDATCVRLVDYIPKPDKYCNETVGIVSRGVIYRTSTRFPIWNRERLLSLLKPGESAWDFEIIGTSRSDIYDGFYATREDYFSTVNCVIKGKWDKNAISKILSLGIDLNIEKREMMSWKEMRLESLRVIRSNVLNIFPSRYRRTLKNIFT